MIPPSLETLSLLKVSGADCRSFLQGQMTCDVNSLKEGCLLRAGYLSPQGRVLTVFRFFENQDAIYAIAPTQGLETIAKRLQMYILRSKVKLEILNACITTINTPLADNSENTLLIPYREKLFFRIDFEAKNALHVDNDFWLSEAKAGEPWVFQETKELFTAHAVNLDRLGAVSFTKGCYTGQEIVSRVQNIGTPPRRTHLYVTQKNISLTPGETAYEKEDNAGRVLYGGGDVHGTYALVEVSEKNTPSQLTIANEVFTLDTKNSEE